MPRDTDRDPQRLTRRAAIASGIGALATLGARRLLGVVPAAGEAPAFQSLLAPAQEMPVAGLVIRSARPLNAEAPLEALTEWLTPTRSFFVRAHFGPPSPIPSPWTLAIDGDVAGPVSFTVDQLVAMPSVSRAVTLECAGNGRGRYNLPNTSGTQWQLGAVSNAEWRGVALGELLERAKLKPEALHIWTEPADHATGGKMPIFLRSISREIAMGDAFIAYEMNGGPVPLLHGGPLRLIVPGWFGMASTKWLAKLHARPVESDNHFMARSYRYPDGSPVQQMRVKSLIASPREGEKVRAGAVRLRGVAWSGAGSGGVRVVELSSDGGRTWKPATLTGQEQPHAWRTWEADVQIASPGKRAIRVRATDRSGAVQPDAATPNPPGYANNSIHEVTVNVTRE